MAVDELRLELELLTLRLELELLLLELRLVLELLLPTLRLELELLPLLTLRLALELLPLLTLRLALELLPLLTLRLEPELLPLLTLRLELELVLLGLSYVEPDCVERDDELPLTEREALERLDVAGATLLTPDDEVPDCDDTLRLELELLPLLTLRLDDELDTLRLELEPLTLRDEDDAATLRDEDDAATLRFEPAFPDADLEATPSAVERLTLRLLLDADIATRSVERLRFLSHPPPLMLRLGVYVTLLSITYVVWP